MVQICTAGGPSVVVTAAQIQQAMDGVCLVGDLDTAADQAL